MRYMRSGAIRRGVRGNWKPDCCFDMGQLRAEKFNTQEPEERSTFDLVIGTGVGQSAQTEKSQPDCSGLPTHRVQAVGK